MDEEARKCRVRIAVIKWLTLVPWATFVLYWAIGAGGSKAEMGWFLAHLVWPAILCVAPWYYVALLPWTTRLERVVISILTLTGTAVWLVSFLMCFVLWME